MSQTPDTPDNPVGDLAVNLLAYAAMGAEEALQSLTLASSGITLGAVMVTWYQMCQNAVGADETARLARRTAQAFHTSTTNIPDTDRTIAYSIARGLLVSLAATEMNRFVDLWESTMNHPVEVITETVALMLGFTRGVLDSVVGA